MKLTDLFTRGATLADVPPDFRGMPMKEWHLQNVLAQITIQGEAHRLKLAKAGVEPPAWSTRAAATPRDSYGWRSI